MGGPETTIPEIERIVLVHHPAAKELALDCESELCTSRLGREVILRTSEADIATNAAMLGDTLQPGDAVGVVAGDGTFRNIAAAVGDTPVTSVAGGNARDIGRALHGKKELPPSQIFSRSVAVSAFALDCLITAGDETTAYRAISYIGCGKSANASDFINSAAYRDDARRRRRDVRVGLQTLNSGYTFPLVDHTGRERKLSDLTIAKGPCMAKYGKLPMVRHWDPHYRVVPVAGNRPAAYIAASRLMLGIPGGNNRPDEFCFTLPEDTLMHFDGDVIPVLGGSEVSIELAPKPYMLLTTRLSAAANSRS
jgi:hypothetical protein